MIRTWSRNMLLFVSACAKYCTWIYHKLFCQIIFHCPKANKIIAKAMNNHSLLVKDILSILLLWYMVVNYIIFDYICIPRVYFPRSLRVSLVYPVHLRYEILCSGKWQNMPLGDKEKPMTTVDGLMIFWLGIWKAQFYFVFFTDIFLMGQERWWKEQPTLGFKMINGVSTWRSSMMMIRLEGE